MSQDFDDLMRSFTQAQLGPQRGALADGFQPIPARPLWRRIFAPLAMAAAFFLAAGLAMVYYPAHPIGNGTAVAAAPSDASESITDEIWYRDIPGQTVLLEDNTAAQVVYRQVYQIRTTVSDQGNEVSTEELPSDTIALVSQPVF